MFAQLSWRWMCHHHVSQICSFSHMFEPVGFPERQIEPSLQSLLQQEKPNVCWFHRVKCEDVMLMCCCSLNSVSSL